MFKTTCIILTLLLVLSDLPQVCATSFFNENFEGDTYSGITISNHQNFTINSMLKVARSDSGNALSVTSEAGGTASGGQTAMTVKPENLVSSNKIYLSFDINFAGFDIASSNIMKVMAAHSSSDSNRWSYTNNCVFTYSDGKIRLGDASMVAEVWYTVYIEFDTVNHIQTIAVSDSNAVVQYAVKYTAISENFTGIYQLNFTPLAASTVLYDNIKISSDMEFNYERPMAFMKYSGGNGSYGFSYIPKDNITELAPIGTETVSRVHINRSNNTNDAYIDVSLPYNFSVCDNFVLEFEYYPVKIGTSLRMFRAIGPDSVIYDFLKANSGGTFSAVNTSLGTPALNTWTKFQLSVNKKTKTGSVYINGIIVAENISFNSYNGFDITKMRIGTDSGGTGTEFYLDNIILYEFDGLYKGDEFDFSSNNVMENRDGSSKAVNLIGSDAVFMEERDCFFKGSKQKYSEYGVVPCSKDGTFMLPLTVLDILNIDYSLSGDSINANNLEAEINSTSYTLNGVTKSFAEAPCIYNSVVYIPVADFLESCGLFVYRDNRGFIMVSDKEITYQNSYEPYYNTENIDTIYRYLFFDRPTGDQIYSKLLQQSQGNAHPRILATADRIANVKANILNDSRSKKMYDYAISRADALLGIEPVEYEIPDGLRLFGACITVRNRISTLGVAYMLTEDEKYALQIWAEMENSLNWVDWNTSNHFLDSGKIGPGIAIGYDVLYNYLTSEQKAWVRQRVKDLYLDVCESAYNGTYSGSEFRTAFSNWGAVCSGSILTVAMTFMDDETGENLKQLKFLAENSLHSLEYPAGLLGPDGGWYEGMGYWGYVTEYLTTYCIGVMTNSCGDDFGFLDSPGVQESFDFATYMNAPSGIYNYSECGESGDAKYAPQGYQMAFITDNETLMDNQYTLRQITGGGKDSMDVLWFEPRDSEFSYINLNYDKFYRGSEIGVMKGSWYDSNAAYVGMRAGINTSTGSHFDKGSFIFENQGERWAIDLGKDDYNIVGGYFGSSGYTLYRKRTEGHNCIVINPCQDPGQNYLASTNLAGSASSASEAYMMYDLSEAYADNTSSVKRGFFLGDDRESLKVRDEINLNETSDVYWFMHTRANIEIDADGKGATLTQNGKAIHADFICSANEWRIEERDTTYFDTSMIREGEYSRDGIKKLTLVTRASGNLTITVKLTPLNGEAVYDNVTDTPLSEWTVSDISLFKGPSLNGPQYLHLNADGTAGLEVTVPMEADKTEIYMNGKLISTSYPSDFPYSGNRMFLLKNNSGKINALIEARSYMGNETVSSFREYIFGQVQETTSVFETDFFSLSENDTAGSITQNVGFTAFASKSGHLSAEKVSNDSDASLRLTVNDTRTSNCGYIEYSRNLLSSACNISFDIALSSDNMGMYFSAKQADNTSPIPAIITVFSKTGEFADGRPYYAGEKYHVDIFLNMVTGVYTEIITDSSGEVLSNTGGTLLCNGLSLIRLTFDSLSAGSFVDLDNFKIQSIKTFPSIIKNYSVSGDYNKEIKVTLTGSNAQGLLFGTVYVDNRMTDIKIIPFSLNGSEEFSFNFAIPEYGIKKCIKLFLRESNDLLTEGCGYIEIE